MDGSERGDDLAIEAALLDRLVEDRRQGRLAPRAHYEALYPGHEDVVRRTYAEIEVGRSGGDDASTAAVPQTPAADSKIGRFRILGELGRGGQANVYRAEDPSLRRTVALKVLTVGANLSDSALRRFRREAEIASRLDHPGICPVYETGVDGGLTWIAMRCVEGETLARRIAAALRSKGSESVISDSRAGKPPAATSSGSSTARTHALRVIAFMEKVARIVHAAHEAGVIHRDVKPGNIMVLPDGEPVVLDFGLARTEDATASLVTQTGDFLGTPSYMAPEQLAVTSELVDRRTDVWGLGVTLYEALTLKRPFEDSTRGGLEASIRSRDPSRVHCENSQVPRDLEAVVEKALEKNPRRRYATAAELADELHRVLVHEPVKAKPAGPVVRTQRWVQRNPVPALLILVLAASLATTLVLLERIRVALRHAQALSLTHDARELRETDPDRALHVALQAYDLEPTLPEAVSEIHSAVALHHPVIELPHGDMVRSARVSRDGKRLLTACDDGIARILDARDGRELQRMVGHEYALPDAAEKPDLLFDAEWSSDETRVLTCSRDKTARIFDRDAREVVVLRHPGAVQSAVFTPDGTEVLTGCEDGWARTWGMDGAGLKEWGADENPIRAAVSPDGARILTYSYTLFFGRRSDRETARLWALDGTPVGEPMHHADQIRAASFSPHGDTLVTASHDGTAVIWDRDGGRLHELAGHASGLVTAEYSTNGERLITGSYDGTARVWDARSGALIHELPGHGGSVQAAAFSADGAFNVTAGKDLQPRLWGEDGFLLDVFRGFTEGEYVLLAGFLPPAGGKPRIITSLQEGPIRIWEAWQEELPVLYARRGSVLSVAVARDGTRVATGGQGIVGVWSVDGTPIRSFGFGAAGVVSLAFSPDATRIVAGSRDRRIRIWDVARGGAPIEIPVWNTPNSLAISPKTSLIAAAILGRGIGLWNMEGHLVWERVEAAAYPVSVAFSPDEGCLLAGLLAGGAQRWSLEGGLLQEFPTDATETGQGVANYVAFHPAGREFVGSGRAGRMIRRDLGGHVLGFIDGPEQAMRFADYSSDGSQIAATYVDGSVRLWRLDGTLVANLSAHRLPAFQVRFSADSSRLLTASFDGTCRSWFARTEDLLRHARKLDAAHAPSSH